MGRLSQQDCKSEVTFRIAEGLPTLGYSWESVMSGILQKIEKFLGVILLYTIFILIVVQIFFRYIIGKPIFWSDELSSYLFIWMVMIGMSYVQSMNAHVKMDIISSKLGKKYTRIIGVVLNILILLFLVTSFVPSLTLVEMMKKIKTPGLRIPWAFVLASAPVCFALLFLHIANDTISLLRKGGCMPGKENPVETQRIS